MRIDGKPKAIALSIFLLLLTLTVTALGQEPASLVASAKGEGTIKLGQEEFKLHALVVKLFEGGKAELQLVTDVTVFASGTWARNDKAEKDIELKIGTNTMANMAGGGTLFLTDDRKSIKGLKLEILNKISQKVIKVDFTAKSPSKDGASNISEPVGFR